MEYGSCSRWEPAVWVWLPIKGMSQVFATATRILLKRSERYDGQVEYLENFNYLKRSLEKGSWSTFSTIDRPLSAAQKGAVAFTLYRI